MVAHLVVGATGTGKTTFVYSLLQDINKNNIYVYDINNEYRQYYDEPFEDFKEFINSLKKVENKVLVFEEATIFFDCHATSEVLLDLLVRKRHTQNYIIMFFHSLSAVPRYVLRLSNTLTLFKTLDTQNDIKSKYGESNITELFYDIKDDINKHVNLSLNLG